MMLADVIFTNARQRLVIDPRADWLNMIVITFAVMKALNLEEIDR